ncbi:MAG: hypothetical protein V2G42_03135 [bacterium JZ-2024 1]
MWIYFLVVSMGAVIMGVVRDTLAERRVAVQKEYELAVQVKENHQRQLQEMLSAETIRERARAEGMTESGAENKR